MFNFDRESIKKRFNCWGNQYSSLFADILIVANESRGIIEKSKNSEDYDIESAKELFNDAEGDDYKLLRYSDFPENKVEKVKSARPYGLIYAMIEVLAEFAESCDDAEIQKAIDDIINNAYEFWSVDISSVWGKASLVKMFYNAKHTELITSLKKLAANLVENANPVIAPQVSKLLISIFLLTKGMRLNMERLKKFYAADWLYDWLNKPFVDFLNAIENHCRENQRKYAQRSVKGNELEHPPEPLLEKAELKFIDEYKQIFTEWKTRIDDGYRQSSEIIQRELEFSNDELQKIQEWLDEINEASSLNEKFKAFFNHFSSKLDLEEWLISSSITDEDILDSYSTTYYSYYTILNTLLHYWQGIRMDTATLSMLTDRIQGKIGLLQNNDKNYLTNDNHEKTSKEIKNATDLLILDGIENDEHFDGKINDFIRNNIIIEDTNLTLEQRLHAYEENLNVLTTLNNLISDLTKIFPRQNDHYSDLKNQAKIKLTKLLTELIQSKTGIVVNQSELSSLLEDIKTTFSHYQQRKQDLIHQQTLLNQQEQINTLDEKIAKFFASEPLTLENGSRFTQKNYQECLVQLHSNRAQFQPKLAQSLEKQFEQRREFISKLENVIRLKSNGSKSNLLSTSDSKLTQLSTLFNGCFDNIFSSESSVNQEKINEIDDAISGFFSNDLLQMEVGTYLNKPTYNECKILLHNQRANSAFSTQDAFEKQLERRQALIKKLEAIIKSKKQEAQDKLISRSLEDIEKIEKVFNNLFSEESPLQQVHASPVSQFDKKIIKKPQPDTFSISTLNDASCSSSLPP